MRLGVPLYVHPAVDPGSWKALEAHADEIDWVVVNAADGPGSLRDGVLESAVDGIQQAGIAVLGYVDGSYGRRMASELREDQRRWREWYHVAGIFLDQVPGDRERWVRGAVQGLRGAGATRVVGNPGNAIDAESATRFDGVVVFEGMADAHRALARPSGRHDGTHPSKYHLVYGVSRRHVGETVARAQAAGAAAIWVTGSVGTNPYGGVPEYFRDVVAMLSTTRRRPVVEPPLR